MDKLRMQSSNGVEDNITKIAQLFPDCVTETVDERSGQPKHLIDFEKLKQNLSDSVISERAERYQFTWPEKSKAILLANSPINATLRPCREDSVDFDNTQNLYIEGDNLDVLKCLKETYLHKVKMIYIDPPYNTGNDFVYEDDFAQSSEEYLANSGLFDEQGNRMFTNAESNGRFHTDWLNMIYPRLKVARDLLTDDGVIFISIDENEHENLRRLCNEIFGQSNYRNTLLVRRRIKSLNSQFADNGLWSLNVGFEYVLVYAKSDTFLMKALRQKKENASSKGRWDVFWSNADRPTMRYEILGFTPSTGQWRNSKEKADIAVANYKKYEAEYANQISIEEYSKETGITDFIRKIPNGTGKNGGVQHWVAPSDTSLRTSNWTDIEVSQIGKEIPLPFDNPKSKQLMLELLKLCNDKDSLILDFFSGSATTAHAVMQLNSEDGGNRKFIMVQLPEKTDEKSEAFKAGYKNICEIGKERIRRAGKKIKEESPLTTQDLDTGFRVLKLDSTNMQDIYYSPKDISQADLFSQVDNVKPDRTGEDLLFQVMLELGATLDSKIETTTVAGKTIYNVAEGYLVACFDPDVTDDVVKSIAQMQPAYAVLRDTSMKDDSTATNFEQIFKTYSPNTVTKIL
ncbi:site-specific DNA-methyltransferase [Prevotella copri]|uniref:site-specific DNA-methyltransferase n=1 Tax=Segatella copri TaxID=165179 RepID=UPI001F402EBE|nr:site-specific DNA-methyltransferase [Segatella copri]MCF2609121.1 site-specific DNA-methyltransferase [Segatella copri]